MEIVHLITLIFLYLIRISSSQDKSFTFELVEKQNFPIISLKMGDQEVEALYSGLRHNSPIHVAFSEDKYKVSEEKYTQKNSTIRIFGSDKVNGKVYKDKFQLNGKELGDIEFLLGKINYTGFINFGIPSLEMLKGNGTITKKIVSYNTTNKDKKIYVTLGKDYNISLFNHSHVCNVTNNYSGCIIEKVVVANSKDDFIKGKFSDNINIGIAAEFYDSSSFFNGPNFISGNLNYTSKIRALLQKEGFNCTGIECVAQQNKSAYFVFGKKGIKFTKMKIQDNTYKNILFGFKSIEDLDVIIDGETNKVIFHTEKDDVILETTNPETNNPSSGFKWWYILIIVAVIALVVGIIIFVKRQKSEETDGPLIENYEQSF